MVLSITIYIFFFLIPSLQSRRLDLHARAFPIVVGADGPFQDNREEVLQKALQKLREVCGVEALPKVGKSYVRLE